MAQDPYTKKKTDLEFGTEGARSYRGGAGGIPPGKPGIEPRFIQKLGVKNFPSKDGHPRWEVTWNGDRVGYSQGHQTREEAIKTAKKHIAKDPDYKLPDF